MNLFRSSANNSGKVISIAPDANHVWIPTKLKTLFVRSCYNDIWGQVEQHYFRASAAVPGGSIIGTESDTADGFVVSGTPGVGKSCFLDFCLHNLLRLKRSVCYFYGKTMTARVYEANGNVKTYRLVDSDPNTLASEVDFLLIDPPENGDPNFLGGREGLSKKKFVLAVSPDRNDCQAIRKDTTTFDLYMGTSSLQEAEEMRVACYDNVTHQRLVLRFNEFGGIPRYLFKKVLDENLDTGLNRIRGQQRSALMDVIKNPNRIDDMENSDPFESLWTLYHMEPIALTDGSINYYGYTIQPCCQNASTRIRDALMQKRVRDLWNTFTSTREELGTLRGIRYEAYAHKKILVDGLAGIAMGLTQKGGSMAALKTITIPAGFTTINLPNNRVYPDLQTAVNNARTLQGGYLLPHLPNFPVVDSIFVPSGNGEAKQLQMKAGRNRPLATDKAASIASATGSTDLYFIVPDEFTMTKELQGVDGWRQYRVILRETT